MKVTMMLADAAQVADGKLYILGGGWSVTGPGPSGFAIALKIEVPWDQTNQRHHFALRLLDQDAQPALIAGATDPLVIEGEFEVGRPAGIPAGSSMAVPLVVAPAGPVPFPPGMRLVWSLEINGEHDEDWELPFNTRHPRQ